MTVAIIFIGTGQYLSFLPMYYKQAETNLFPGVDKKFFAFTDGEITDDVPENIVPIPTEHKDWPRITLERFHIIKQAEEQLKECDYVLFLDADMYVNEEVVFDTVFNGKDFVGVWHPCHNLKMQPHDKPPGTFESNPESTAYLENAYDVGIYWQGCLWGGKTEAVLEMLDVITARIDEDDSNDIIAVWHDESHMNRFFCENVDRVNTLPPSFAFPECYPGIPFDQTIVHLAKNNSKFHV